MKKVVQKNVIKTEEVSVTPQFSLPATLDSGKYLIDDNDLNDDVEFGDAEASVEIIDNPPIDDVSNILQTPSSIIVKSQIVRLNDSGQQVVDVVLTIADVEGATNYEVRISKS